MIIIILVCVGFGTSTHLTNAYGLAVATVMIVTTTLLTMVMYFVWGLVFIIPLSFLLFFGTIDGAFWGGNFPLSADNSHPHKIPSGRMVSLHGGYLNDHVHVLLALGNDQETPL